MTITTTAALPKDHPLRLLLERSQKANKLPSCGECKQMSSTVKAAKGTVGYCIAKCIQAKANEFCEAWEPKA